MQLFSFGIYFFAMGGLLRVLMEKYTTEFFPVGHD